ncbi:amidohydrolase [Halosolutus halophilus]|uniref:amidohydrolase n=1 Tax=Halosolutus halophilus TaxID=1552990 RepID=UPI002235101F|nr:amidohydrolase [Halosolutus halophilus]
MTDDVLYGAIDCHVHTAPDLVERYQTDLALAREAIQAGMRGVVVKSHVLPTVGRVDQVNEALGATVLHGGVALNGTVGGLNPDAVETALELGARIVWLPTAWAANHASQARAAGRSRFVGQRVPGSDEEIRVARDGEVTEATQRVVNLVAEHDATLGTGHASPEEIDAVVEACDAAGVRCLVNHPCFRLVDLPLERQVALAERGAVMEYCAYAVESTPDHSVDRLARAVNRIGPERCLLATDYGQAENAAVSGLATFAREVQEAGVPREAVRTMLTETPARVLGL